MYSLTAIENTIQRSDGAWIPADPDNKDYQAYLAWVAEGNTPDPYVPPPAPVPQIISDRQFFQQAAIDNIITQAEALAAVKIGDIPAVLQAIVDAIPDDNQKFAAQMLLSGATTFDRTHMLTEIVRTSLGWTTEQIDQFFINAAQL